MRRLVANSVLLITLGMFFAPAVAVAVPQPVPICCRRDGAHHCAAMAETAKLSGTSLRANNPCPMRQGPQLGSSIVALPASALGRIELHHQLLIDGAVTFRRFSPSYAEHQRGPPARHS